MRHILVPTDHSAPSETALDLAGQLARRAGADVTITHVDPFPGFALMSAEPVYLPPQLWARLRRSHDQHLEDALRELARRLPDDLNVAIRRRTGDPVQEIIGLADEIGAELIVMGSHGRGATRFFLGSVTEKVSRAAPCPVLVTRVDSKAGQTGAFERVLCAIDYSRFSRVSAKFAAQFASETGSVELLHVWEEPHSLLADPSFVGAAELAEAAESGRADQATALAEFASGLDLSIQPSTYVASGNVARAILERAEAIGADLIVVGAHSREHIEQRLLGTTADRVLRHAQVPVLLIPDAALAPSWRAPRAQRQPRL